MTGGKWVKAKDGNMGASEVASACSRVAHGKNRACRRQISPRDHASRIHKQHRMTRAHPLRVWPLSAATLNARAARRDRRGRLKPFA